MEERVRLGFEAVALGDITQLKQLLGNGLAVEATNDQGLSLLLLAAATGQDRLVELLLEKGADPQRGDPRGLSPLMYSAAKGHEDVVRLLLDAKVDPEKASAKGLTPLMFAAAGKYSQVARRLLDAGAKANSKDEQGCTALHFAANAGHTACVRRILAYGADANAKDASGNTPADLADQSGFHDTVVALGGTPTWRRDIKQPKTASAMEQSLSDEDERALQSFEQIVADMREPVAEELAEMLELESQAQVRKALQQIYAVAELSRERAKRGLPQLKHSYHAAFAGSAGVGKETFAHNYGRSLRQLGVLSYGLVTKVSRHDLTSEFKGQTVGKTTKAFERAKGGILYIEDAPRLSIGEQDQVGLEAIDTLARLSDQHQNSVVVVLGGDTKELQNFLRLHPALQHQVRHLLKFDDLTQLDLGLLLDNRAKSAQLVVTSEARAEALRRLAVRKKGRRFGNAREIDSLFSEALAQQSARLAKQDLGKLTEAELCTLIYSDFTEEASDDAVAASAESKPLNPQAAVDKAIARLESLIGLADVKREIRDLTNFLRVQRARLGGKQPELTAHMVFAGNPGTGKTTVARLLGDIFKEIGLLPSGHLIETDRSGLVGGYVGQTALKTKERLDEAHGGVLFVDEAYTLHRGEGQDDSFGREAIETILKYMEDNRGGLVVVLAGYTGEMQTFLSANPGLKSRFAKVVSFVDYSAEELEKIAGFMLENSGFRMSGDGMTKLLSLVEARRNTEEHFANAREIRNLLESAYKRHASRILRLGAPETLDQQIINTLEADDVEAI